MQIPPQKRPDVHHVEAPQPQPAHLVLAAPARDQRRRQRDDVRVDEAMLVLGPAVGAVVQAARRENAVNPDERPGVLPRAGVRGDVAEEEEDLEGAV